MLRKGRHAFHMGRPLNWQVVIDFGIQPKGNERQPEIDFTNIRNRVYNWWRYRRQIGVLDGQLFDWWTWEAPNGKAHVNWLLNIPEHLQEEAATMIEKRCKTVLVDLACDTVDQKEVWNTNGAMKYALKGTDAEYAKKIKIRPSDQGRVWGRRASGARALGQAARKAS